MQRHGAYIDPDAAQESDYNVGDTQDDPADLINAKVSCRDKTSGEIVEYLVVDYMNSLVGGEFFMLEDAQGRRRDITPEELKELRVD